MKRIIYIIIQTSIFILATSSCVSLNEGERAIIAEIQEAGLSEKEIKVKEPFVAGSLALLPGIGNFYLGTGTKYSGQWFYGGLNLISWPYSIVWSLPQVVIDANTMNKKKTVDYYRNNVEGRRRIRLRSQ